MKHTVAPPRTLVACSSATADSLIHLVSILLNLAQDALKFLLLGTRSSAALKAENIFLRKQLSPLPGARD
jgi:hypothetical protein